jgi:hypothetical protein
VAGSDLLDYRFVLVTPEPDLTLHQVQRGHLTGLQALVRITDQTSVIFHGKVKAEAVHSLLASARVFEFTNPPAIPFETSTTSAVSRTVQSSRRSRGLAATSETPTAIRYRLPSIVMK